MKRFIISLLIGSLVTSSLPVSALDVSSVICDFTSIDSAVQQKDVDIKALNATPRDERIQGVTAEAISKVNTTLKKLPERCQQQYYYAGKLGLPFNNYPFESIEAVSDKQINNKNFTEVVASAEVVSVLTQVSAYYQQAMDNLIAAKAVRSNPTQLRQITIAMAEEIMKEKKTAETNTLQSMLGEKYEDDADPLTSEQHSGTCVCKYKKMEREETDRKNVIPETKLVSHEVSYQVEDGPQCMQKEEELVNGDNQGVNCEFTIGSVGAITLGNQLAQTMIDTGLTSKEYNTQIALAYKMSEATRLLSSALGSGQPFSYEDITSNIGTFIGEQGVILADVQSALNRPWMPLLVRLYEVAASGIDAKKEDELKQAMYLSVALDLDSGKFFERQAAKLKELTNTDFTSPLYLGVDSLSRLITYKIKLQSPHSQAAVLAGQLDALREVEDATTQTIMKIAMVPIFYYAIEQTIYRTFTDLLGMAFLEVVVDGVEHDYGIELSQTDKFAQSLLIGGLAIPFGRGFGSALKNVVLDTATVATSKSAAASLANGARMRVTSKSGQLLASTKAYPEAAASNEGFFTRLASKVKELNPLKPKKFSVGVFTAEEINDPVKLFARIKVFGVSKTYLGHAVKLQDLFNSGWLHELHTIIVEGQSFTFTRVVKTVSEKSGEVKLGALLLVKDGSTGEIYLQAVWRSDSAATWRIAPMLGDFEKATRYYKPSNESLLNLDTKLDEFLDHLAFDKGVLGSAQLNGYDPDLLFHGVMYTYGSFIGGVRSRLYDLFNKLQDASHTARKISPNVSNEAQIAKEVSAIPSPAEAVVGKYDAIDPIIKHESQWRPNTVYGGSAKKRHYNSFDGNTEYVVNIDSQGEQFISQIIDRDSTLSPLGIRETFINPGPYGMPGMEYPKQGIHRRLSHFERNERMEGVSTNYLPQFSYTNQLPEIAKIIAAPSKPTITSARNLDELYSAVYALDRIPISNGEQMMGQMAVERIRRVVKKNPEYPDMFQAWDYIPTFDGLRKKVMKLAGSYSAK